MAVEDLGYTLLGASEELLMEGPATAEAWAAEILDADPGKEQLWSVDRGQRRELENRIQDELDRPLRPQPYRPAAGDPEYRNEGPSRL